MKNDRTAVLSKIWYRCAPVIGKSILLLSIFSIFLPVNADTDESKNDLTVRTPAEILEGIDQNPGAEAVMELFTNCTVHDAAHQHVRDSSREALIALGVAALPPLLENYLSSEALYHRIELNRIVTEIGQRAAEYLIPYLTDEDSCTRSHAAYLIGSTAAIGGTDDPYRLGPLEEDRAAIEALRAGLERENDWKVIRSLVGAAGAMRDPGLLSLLAAFIEHDEQSVRLAAVIALGEIPHRNASLHMIRAFSDSVATVRQAAILQSSRCANGNLGFAVLLEIVRKGEHADLVRLCALDAITRYLSDCIDANMLQVVKQIEQARSVVQWMLGEGRSEQWTVRGYAVEILGIVPSDDTIDFLTELKQREPHPFVLGKIDLILADR
jgi:HEAT repeat protein